ncbi:MAG: methyltransferase domain-containing protein [Dehalococcoidales bacterium]|nr:methyltransferase domain-containing protein [Dehalococcoidales bacterium]
MSFSGIREIDWDRMWEIQAGHILNTGNETAAFWDKRSESYEKNTSKSSYADDLMNRMCLCSGYSVLDIGGGTGLMAIPIAQKVDKVTVLDISSGMLRILKDKIDSCDIKNIAIVNDNWHEMDVRSGIEQHDIVLASRFLPMGKKLKDSLANMNRAAKRFCYATWRANSFDKVEAESCRLLNKNYTPYPEYPVISNCLYTMGIKANTEFFQSTSEQFFTDLDEAVLYFAKGEKPDIKQAADKYRAFVESLLERRNDGFYRGTITQWVLLWWEVYKDSV